MEVLEADRVHAAGVHDARALRSAVADAVEAGYRRAGCAVPEALGRFRSGARTVTTGHQLVIAGGPAYLHAKAMTAIRRAGGEGVAVFWLASEDHDAREAGTLPGTDVRWIPSEGGPVGRWKVDEELCERLGDWADRAGVHAADREALLAEAIPGRRYSEVFLCWMDRWFRGMNLVVIDGDDPVLKSLAAPLLRAEATGMGIAPAVEATTTALEAAGYPAQARSRAVNLFELVAEEEGAGRRVRIDAPVAIPDAGERWERWSPGVLLRPLYQEWLLGSDAVVGGPAEVAYWLQCYGAFRTMGVPFPALHVRDSVVVHGRGSRQLSDQTDFNPVLDPPAALADRVRAVLADRAIPESVSDPVHAALAEFESALTAAARPVDPTLEGAARAAAARARGEWDALAKKIRKAYKIRHSAEVAEIECAADWIAPGGEPQERVRTALELAGELGGWEAWRAVWMEAAAGWGEEPVAGEWG